MILKGFQHHITPQNLKNASSCYVDLRSYIIDPFIHPQSYSVKPSTGQHRQQPREINKKSQFTTICIALRIRTETSEPDLGRAQLRDPQNPTKAAVKHLLYDQFVSHERGGEGTSRDPKFYLFCFLSLLRVLPRGHLRCCVAQLWQSKENDRRLVHFSRVPNPFRKNNFSRPGKFHVSLPLVSRFFPAGLFFGCLVLEDYFTDFCFPAAVIFVGGKALFFSSCASKCPLIISSHAICDGKRKNFCFCFEHFSWVLVSFLGQLMFTHQAQYFSSSKISNDSKPRQKISRLESGQLRCFLPSPGTMIIGGKFDSKRMLLIPKKRIWMTCRLK